MAATRGTYRRIADELRKLIRAGDLPAGVMLPSEMALASQWKVSRGTARAALAVLVDEGLAEIVPGRGRRVVGSWDSGKLGAIWERIADNLRRRLADGEFAPDEPLPSEATLVAEYNVSRNSVRRAYRQLILEGRVVVRHGAGAFPAPR